MAFDGMLPAHNTFSSVPVVTNDDGTQTVVTPESEYKLPKHIQLHEFHTRNGVPIRFYTALAKNETTMIFGASGYKTDFILTPSEIKTLNDQGVSVAWLALPNPGRNTHFMDHILEAAEEVLISPRYAEIRRWCMRDVPKIFFGHSTGAQLFLRMAAEGHHEQLNGLFSGAVLSSPYITPPGTENPLAPATMAFDAYAWRHGNSLPSETAMGRAYLSDSERTGFDRTNLAKYQVPTYAQIQELRSSGATVLNAIRDPENNIHRLNMPFLVAAGAGDKFSSPKISAEIASALEGAFYYAQDTEHSPISSNPEGFNISTQAIHAMAKGTFNQFATHNDLHNYGVNSERFIVSKIALSTAGTAAVALKQQLSPARLGLHMQTLFSRMHS